MLSSEIRRRRNRRRNLSGEVYVLCVFHASMICVHMQETRIEGSVDEKSLMVRYS